MIDPKILQYGAFGLLAVVLSGIFILARSIFDRMFAQSEENLKFVREQIEQANAERKGQLQAWIDAYKEQLALGMQTTKVLGEMLKSLDEILITLRHMNGGDK